MTTQGSSLFSNATLDNLILGLLLDAGDSTRNSQETFNLNHLFGPTNVVTQLAKGYAGASGAAHNDICGSVWFANVPAATGLSDLGEDSSLVDLISTLVHPTANYTLQSVPKSAAGVPVITDYTNYVDFSSAAPLLFGASELNTLPSGVTTAQSSYIKNTNSATKQSGSDGNTYYKPAALAYPYLDFSNIHTLVSESINASNASVSDGSGVGVNVTNLANLVRLGAAPFAMPSDDLAAGNVGGFVANANAGFQGLLRMISDVSADTTQKGLTGSSETLVSQFADYPVFGKDQSSDINDLFASVGTINFTSVGVSGDAVFGYPKLGGDNAISYTDPSQVFYAVKAAKTDYLEKMRTQMVNVNNQVKDVEWKNVYDASGFGLNVLAWSGIDSLTNGLAASATSNDVDFAARFGSTYVKNGQTGNMTTIGHPGSYGLLDQAMKSTALEMQTQVDGSSSLIKNAGFNLDLSSGNVYLRLLKLKELGVDLNTLLFWNRNPSGLDVTGSKITDLSDQRYNFAHQVRGISTDNITGLNGGGFVRWAASAAADVSNSPADIPWTYQKATEAVYGSEIYADLSPYDIITRMSQDMATWANIYDRMDISLNGTGTSNQTSSFISTQQQVYHSGTPSTCKAGRIMETFASLKLNAGIDLDENVANGLYDQYDNVWKEISGAEVYPNGTSTAASTIATITAAGGATGDNKAYIDWLSYAGISGNVDVVGGFIAPGTIPFYTAGDVKSFRVVEQLVPKADLLNFAQCPDVTEQDVQGIINSMAGRFKQLPFTSLRHSHAEASGILIAVDYCAASNGAATPASLSDQFSVDDMCMNMVKACYESVFTNATETQIVNKILLDQYDNSIAGKNIADINGTIDSVLDAGFTMDALLHVNPGPWNNSQQIGDTVGIYATADSTTISRAQGIATSFASAPALSYSFFDNMVGGLDISSGLGAPYVDNVGNTDFVNDQQKADMVDFMLFFGVDQDTIYSMMGANDFTRTMWAKNWLKLTRQASQGSTDVSGQVYSAIGTNTTSSIPNAPLAFIPGAKVLINKIPIADLINDADFGLSFAGWGAYKGARPYWVLAKQPYELKAAGVPCDAVILSAITTGYVIDPNTLALEATNKCAFSSAQLQAAGPAGEPGYTQLEINNAVGKI